MTPLHQLIYLQEIQSQCRMALQAGIALKRFLAHKEPMQTIEDGAMQTAEVFRNVHSILTHVANISQLLWPGTHVKGHRKERADQLRSLLDLPEDGHPLSSRDVRNHLEHFDERLDRWAQKPDISPDFWQDSIGPWDVPIEQFKADQTNVMRHFEPQTWTFRFQGEPWNILEMAAHVKILKETVDPVEAEIRNRLYPTPEPIQSDRVRFLD